MSFDELHESVAEPFQRGGRVGQGHHRHEGVAVGQLDRHQKSRGQVMVGYSESNEYKRATSGRVNVIIATYALLRRPATEAEVASGQSQALGTVVTSLFTSAAYQNRY